MKSILLSLLLTLVAASAAEVLPAVSTNRWAGQYLGVLVSASRDCQERAEVDIFVHDDNSVTVIIYDYRLNEQGRATGTQARGRIAVLFGEVGYILF